MTIVLSIASPLVIVMTADSAITLDFENSREYSTGRKAFFITGVGCITTWGARDHNNIGPYLDSKNISRETHSITDFADIVYEYLTHEYRPDQLGLDDVGYHVAGFDLEFAPHLWHIYYGFERPKPTTQTEREYVKRNHSPRPGEAYILFNGRNDLAYPLIGTFITQLQTTRDLKIDLRDPVDIAYFGDYIARFASEITPEVGPPFITYLIGANNNSVKIFHQDLIPLDKNGLREYLKTIGGRIER